MTTELDFHGNRRARAELLRLLADHEEQGWLLGYSIERAGTHCRVTATYDDAAPLPGLPLPLKLPDPDYSGDD